MPTYEYACRACDHQFEREQSITEEPIKKCPSCGKDAASRMISSGNFILKGSGWYSDLYSGPSNKGSEKKDSDAKGSDAKDSDAKGSEKKGSDAKGEATKSDAKKDKGSASSGDTGKPTPRADAAE